MTYSGIGSELVVAVTISIESSIFAIFVGRLEDEDGELISCELGEEAVYRYHSRTFQHW